MKGLAHSYVWWPNIDADLEAQVKQCNECHIKLSFTASSAHAPMGMVRPPMGLCSC